MEQYEQLRQYLKDIGVTITPKSQSWFMKVLSKILFFNKNFLTSYTTTIGKTIYASDMFYSKPQKERIVTLAHEYVHVQQRKWMWLYLMPQIFAIFAILGFWLSPWFFLCLLFLAPLPSPRAYLELEAYKVTVLMTYWILERKANISQIAKNFSGPQYYFMLPFGSKKIQQKLNLIFGLAIQQKTPIKYLKLRKQLGL